MKVYEAINRMRQLSAKNIPFSLSFMTYSLKRNKSEGEVEITNALLYKNSKTDKSAYKDYLLKIRDLDTQEVRQCWQPLLMTFNGEILEGIE